MANELSDALHEIRELEKKLKQFSHRYKESEVWLACFTALMKGKHTSVMDDAELADDAAKEYWERFK